jgi:hypothetical protein
MPFARREVPRGFAVMIIGFGPPFRVGLADQGLERGAAPRSSVHPRTPIWLARIQLPRPGRPCLELW